MATTPKPTSLEDGTELEAFVDAHDIALVELYTSGCSKCQAMESVLGNVARVTGVPIGMINPGNDIELLKRLEVDSVPTLLLYKDGVEIARRAEGFLGTDDVVGFLDKNVPDVVDHD
ncbi:thioredoxin family protein [Natronorubrum thiooxidans]|uniref:Thioredoxin n=1 Tax=Natronorubrum thiooxidans TaxID=308853 RepID=A0A1N7FN67_9EURY|nr:thioredoxin family protein [Natronorubrum thiooxidans]SIS01707.1 Thioredoxin [Natronorubrum thiooxidans]